MKHLEPVWEGLNGACSLGPCLVARGLFLWSLVPSNYLLGATAFMFLNISFVFSLCEMLEQIRIRSMLPHPLWWDDFVYSVTSDCWWIHFQRPADCFVRMDVRTRVGLNSLHRKTKNSVLCSMSCTLISWRPYVFVMAGVSSRCHHILTHMFFSKAGLQM